MDNLKKLDDLSIGDFFIYDDQEYSLSYKIGIEYSCFNYNLNSQINIPKYEIVRSINEYECLNVNSIHNKGILVYEYIRGSHLYGLNTEDSDIDKGGVYILPTEEILSNPEYKTNISDRKHDKFYSEVGHYLNAIYKQNPNIIESLFVPKDKITYKKDNCKFIEYILSNRNLFITKTFVLKILDIIYSLKIKTERSTSKHLNPIEFKSILDFCYSKSDSKVKDLLESDKSCFITKIDGLYFIAKSISDNFHPRESVVNNNIYPIDFNEDEAVLFIDIEFKKDEFNKHKEDLRQYEEWSKCRNKSRFSLEKGREYDSKNLMHCVRYLHMALNVLDNNTLNLKTSNRNMLLKIKYHYYSNDAIYRYINYFEKIIQKKLLTSTLPDQISLNKRDLLLSCRLQNFKNDTLPRNKTEG